jgi:hypothetical protein
MQTIQQSFNPLVLLSSKYFHSDSIGGSSHLLHIGGYNNTVAKCDSIHRIG